jgi:hypothetical protein
VTDFELTASHRLRRASFKRVYWLIACWAMATGCGGKSRRQDSSAGPALSPDAGPVASTDSGIVGQGADTDAGSDAGAAADAHPAASVDADAGSPPLVGYRCQGTTTRIARERVCDGVADCPNGDDEPCHKPVPKCPTQAPMVASWLGARGVCAVGSLGVADYDFSYYSECASGKRIQPSQVCNGLVDCPAGDDEAGCPIECELTCDAAGTTCSGPPCRFFCQDGSTVPKSDVCDGKANCPGGEDELCLDHFECYLDPAHRGIDFAQVCDGINDCPMAEDELECTRRSTFFICDDGNQILFPYFTGGCFKNYPREPHCDDGSAPYLPCPNPH